MSSRKQIIQTVSDTAPVGAALGDEWFQPTTNKLFKRMIYSGVVGWTEIPLSISGATSLSFLGGEPNQILYQTGTSQTGFITAPVSANTFLFWNGSAFAWSGQTPTSANVLTTARTTSADHYLTFVDSNNASASGEAVYTTSSVIVNPGTGRLGVGGSPNAAYIIDAQTTGSALLRIWSTNNSGNTGIFLQGAGDRGSFYSDASYNHYIEPNAQFGNTNIILKAKNDSTNTNRVGINIVTPLSVLHVSGDARITGITTVTNITQSTSTATGALQVIGGVGIGGNLYVGGEIVAQKLTIQLTTVTTTLIETDDIIKTTNVTQATATATGALQIAGGASVGGNLWVGGTVFGATISGTINTATNANNIATVLQTANASYFPVFVDTNNAASAYELAYTTSSFVINPQSGNVGIGVTSPAVRFVVSNNGTNGFEFNTADNIFQTYNRTTSLYTDFLAYSLNHRIFTGTAPTERIRITSTGDVGIGATSPAGILDVRSSSTNAINAYILNTAPYGANNTASSILNLGKVESGTVQVMGAVFAAPSGPSNSSEGFLSFYTRASSAISERVRITNGGNLGIGLIAPESRLHVSGDARISGITTITNTTQASSTSTGALQVIGGVGIGGNLWVGGTINATIQGISSTATSVATVQQTANASYFPVFVDANNATSAYELLHTTSSFIINPATGNIGIGATSPNYKLDVAGSISMHDEAQDLDSRYYGATYLRGWSEFAQGTESNITYNTTSTSPVGTEVLTIAGTATWARGPKIRLDRTQNYEVEMWIRKTAGASAGQYYMVVSNWDVNGIAIGGDGTDWHYPTSAVNQTSLTTGTWVKHSFVVGPYGGAKNHNSTATYIGVGFIVNLAGGTDTLQLTGFKCRPISRYSNDALTIFNSGNIAIGTTATTTRLDVAGGARITGITTITNVTQATATATGALQVAGGASIGGNLWVGGTVFGATISGTINTATNIAGGSAGLIPIQSASGTTTFIPAGSSGNLLQYGTNTATFVSTSSIYVGNALVANDVAGGSTGQLLYQAGASDTGYVGPGSIGQILVSAGASAPTYVNTGSIYVGRAIISDSTTLANSADALTGGAAGRIPIQSGAGATSFIGTGTSGQVLTWSGNTATWAAAGVSTSATNISGGSLGTILIQSSTGTTAFIPAGSSGNLLQYGTNTATFVSTTTLHVGNANNANNIATVLQTTSATYFPVFVDANNATSANELLHTTSSFVINPSTGNVGIGGSNPTGKLDVVGTGGTVRISSAGTVISFTNNGANFITASGGSASLYYESNDHFFRNGAGITTYAVIRSAGVGIGLTSPESKLHVVGDARITGITTVTNTTLSTSTNSGAFQVVGGVGIGGGLFLGGTLDVNRSGASAIRITNTDASNSTSVGSLSFKKTADYTTFTPFNELAGIFISDSIDSVRGAIRFFKGDSGTITYVGIHANSNGGTATSTLLVTPNYAAVQLTTAASSTNSGAFRVLGGAGIAGNLYVGGTIFGAISGAISTASNLAGGVTGAIPVQSAPGVTAFIPAGSSGNLLQYGTNTATFVSTTTIHVGNANSAVNSTNATNATNAANVATVLQTANAAYFPVFVDANNATSANELLHTTSSFQINPQTGNVAIGSGPDTYKFYIKGGALAASTGSQSLLARFNNNNSNESYLEISDTRVTNGSDWTTAGARIQQKIDATWHGWIQFNNGSTSTGETFVNNNQGISFGTGGSTASAVAVPETMRLTTAGNLGIGTKSPGGKLEVFQTAASPAIRMFTNFVGGNAVDLNPFIVGTSNGGYSVSIGGTIRQVIDTNGNFGIGINSPASRLHVGGITRISDSTNSTAVAIDPATTAGLTSIIAQFGGSQLAFGSAATESMRIDASGNVLVGTTTAGSAGLAVNPASNISFAESSGESLATIFRQANSADLVLGSGVRRSGTANGFASSSASAWARSSVNVGYGAIKFFTAPEATVAAGTDVTMNERMRIDSVGNVGIGTISPSFRLESIFNSASNVGMRIQNTSTTQFAGSGLAMCGPSVGAGAAIYYYNNNVGGTQGAVSLNRTDSAGSYQATLFNYDYTSHFWNFFTNGTERMRIDSAGDVGIGTSDPVQKLHVRTATTGTDGLMLDVNAGANPWIRIIPSSTPGSYNNLTAANDTLIAYSAGTVNTGGLTIAPWNGMAGLGAGLRMDNTGTVRITGLAASSTNTGALQVIGGVGIGGNLWVGGTINGSFSGSAASVANALTINNGGSGAASGSTFNGSSAVTISYNTVGAPSTGGANATGTWNIVAGVSNIANNISGGAAGRIPIQSAAGTTSYIPTGSTNQVLTWSGSTATWAAAPGGTTVNTQLQTANASYFLTFVDSNNAASTAESVFTTSTFTVNPRTGNVGVGHNAPVTRLHVGAEVADDNGYTYDTNSLMVVHQTPTSSSTLNDPKETLVLARQGTGAQSFGAAATFDLSRYENSGVDSRTRLDIKLANASFLASPTIAMTLLSSGNIGIGTTSPGYRLDIAAADTTAGIGYGARIRANATAAAGAIQFTNSGASTQHAVIIATTGGILTMQADGASSAVVVRTNGGERARFLASGGFAVGTTSDPGAGAIHATGDITAFFSDQRLKSVVGTIDNALYKISKIKGIYYTNNEVAKSYGYTSDKLQVGVLAQDVELVLPEIIKAAPFDLDENNQSKSGENYKTLQYDKLVPLLVEAIKEQQKIIEGQNTTINKLEEKINLILSKLEG